MVGTSKHNAAELIEHYEQHLGNTGISNYYRKREEGELSLGPQQFSEFMFLIDETDKKQKIVTHGYVDGFLDTKSCHLELENSASEENQKLFSFALTFLFEAIGMESIACNLGSQETIIGRENYIPEDVSEKGSKGPTYI